VETSTSTLASSRDRLRGRERKCGERRLNRYAQFTRADIFLNAAPAALYVRAPSDIAFYLGKGRGRRQASALLKHAGGKSNSNDSR